MLFICLCCLNESQVIAGTLLEILLRKIFLELLSVGFHVSHGYCCLPLNTSLYIYTSDLFH